MLIKKKKIVYYALCEIGIKIFYPPESRNLEYLTKKFLILVSLIKICANFDQIFRFEF